MQMAGTRARRHAERDPLVEGDEARRVALAIHQERERRGKHRSVLQLAHRRRAPVRHRRAHIQQQMAFEVGFLFELLDVVPIASRVDLPVERRQIVARHVLPVLRKLDAESFVWTAMKA